MTFRDPSQLSAFYDSMKTECKGEKKLLSEKNGKSKNMTIVQFLSPLQNILSNIDMKD